jgi:hypothetical protein
MASADDPREQEKQRVDVMMLQRISSERMTTHVAEGSRCCVAVFVPEVRPLPRNRVQTNAQKSKHTGHPARRRPERVERGDGDEEQS